MTTHVSWHLEDGERCVWCGYTPRRMTPAEYQEAISRLEKDHLVKIGGKP